MRVELVLAEVAAIRRVGAVLGLLELVGADDLVVETERLGDANGERSMVFRDSWRCRR